MKVITFFACKFSLSLCDVTIFGFLKSRIAEERCSTSADVFYQPYCKKLQQVLAVRQEANSCFFCLIQTRNLRHLYRCRNGCYFCCTQIICLLCHLFINEFLLHVHASNTVFSKDDKRSEGKSSASGITPLILRFTQYSKIEYKM